LCKWRSVFAGWQLGTRVDTDPEAQAIRDHREVTILLRAEVSALASLLIERKVITVDEFNQQLVIEAEHLERAYEKKFPGYRATDSGMSGDVATLLETMKGWRP